MKSGSPENDNNLEGRAWLVREIRESLKELRKKFSDLEILLHKDNATYGEKNKIRENIRRLIRKHNQAISIIYGEEQAHHLLHFELDESDAVLSFIPAVKTPEVIKKPKSVPRRPKINKQKSRETIMLDALNKTGTRFNYDSNEVIFRNAIEAKSNSGMAEKEVFYHTEIPRGEGIVIFPDNLLHKSVGVMFYLADDLEFILASIELHLENGFSVEIHVNKFDLLEGLVMPINDSGQTRLN
jgi:hypothetical protein